MPVLDASQNDQFFHKLDILRGVSGPADARDPAGAPAGQHAAAALAAPAAPNAPPPLGAPAPVPAGIFGHGDAGGGLRQAPAAALRSGRDPQRPPAAARALAPAQQPAQMPRGAPLFHPR